MWDCLFYFKVSQVEILNYDAFLLGIFVFIFANGAEPDEMQQWLTLFILTDEFSHACWYNKYGIVHFVLRGHQ